MTDPRPAPYPEHHVGAPDASRGLTIGALVAAGVVALLNVVQQAVIIFGSGNGLDFSTLTLATGAVSGISVLAAFVALLLGILAAVRPGGRRLGAGIALGVSGSMLLATAANLLLGYLGNTL